MKQDSIVQLMIAGGPGSGPRPGNAKKLNWFSPNHPAQSDPDAHTREESRGNTYQYSQDEGTHFSHVYSDPDDGTLHVGSVTPKRSSLFSPMNKQLGHSRWPQYDFSEERK